MAGESLLLHLFLLICGPIVAFEILLLFGKKQHFGFRLYFVFIAALNE